MVLCFFYIFVYKLYSLSIKYRDLEVSEEGFESAEMLPV